MLPELVGKLRRDIADVQAILPHKREFYLVSGKVEYILDRTEKARHVVVSQPDGRKVEAWFPERGTYRNPRYGSIERFFWFRRGDLVEGRAFNVKPWQEEVKHI